MTSGTAAIAAPLAAWGAGEMAGMLPVTVTPLMTGGGLGAVGLGLAYLSAASPDGPEKGAALGAAAGLIVEGVRNVVEHVRPPVTDKGVNGLGQAISMALPRADAHEGYWEPSTGLSGTGTSPVDLLA